MATSALAKIQDISKKYKIVENLPSNIPWAPEGASMVVSTPYEIYNIISGIPNKNLLTITAIREYLAKKYSTTIACPISTGIFINLSARASKELCMLGKKFAPWWRVLKADGELNSKFPDAIEGQKSHLEKEGFIVNQIRKKFFVENYKEYIWKIQNI